MSKSIIDYLKEVPDPRGAQGSRDDLWQILLIIIMGIMSGYKGYRGLDRFVERHRRTLVQSNNDYIIKVKKINQKCKKRLDLTQRKNQQFKSILRKIHQKGVKSRDWLRYLHHQQI